MALLSRADVRALNNLGPEAKGMSLGTRLQEALSGDVPAGAISTADVAANAITMAKLVAGMITGIATEDAKTTSREENVAGLASAIALANSLKTVMNAHAADGGGALHVAADATNFPVATANATNLATLLTLSGALLTAYDVHDDDSELGAAWLYHDAQEAGDQSPTSAVTPTTLVEAVTRLNDLKAKYNGHDADGTTHTSGSSANQEGTADAAYGAAILVTVANVATGDDVVWGILNDGTGSVTGVSAVAGTGVVTFTFSGDPQNDAIINYAVTRTAV